MEPEIKDDKMMKEKLQARFLQLPKAVQNAITSAEVEKKLRELSDTHKLHLDQWQKLENEVMLALLGFQPVENLEKNIKNEVGTSDERSKILATAIADTIFQPIREELEKELGKPETEEEKAGDRNQASGVREENPVPPVSSIQDTGYKIPDTISAPPPVQSPVQTSAQSPAQKIIEDLPPRSVEVKAMPLAPVASTPPNAPPTTRSVRATLSPAYAPNTKSHERLAIDDDPYREQIT